MSGFGDDVVLEFSTSFIRLRELFFWLSHPKLLDFLWTWSKKNIQKINAGSGAAPREPFQMALKYCF